MDNFQNKYRLGSNRLKNWDYSSPGSYFITICTKDREHYFGFINNQNMILSELGKVAHQFWSEIPNHFPNIRLGEFVVMPDHVHGILIIESVAIADRLNLTHQQNQQIDQNSNKNEKMSKISPKSGSISTAIRSYKSAVTKSIKEINPDFQWQARFYDHLIKDSVSFHFISEYIISNPKKWKNDSFNV